MIGLDTNVVLRWLIDESIWPDDSPEQTRAVWELAEQPGMIFFVNHVVIAEVIWVLTHGMKQKRAVVVEVIARLLHTNIVIDQHAIVSDALAAFRDEPGDFADHLIGAINVAAKCSTTVTFDRKASRAGRFTRLP